MNRKKKINETLKKRLKKKNARLHKSNKPRYISKAEREKLTQGAGAVAEVELDSSTSQIDPLD
jgi:hypothetical protein